MILSMNKVNSLSAPEIEQKYNTPCDFLKYNAIKDAIPQEWRKILKTMRVPQETISFNEQIHLKINKINKPLQLIKNRDFYWILVKNCQKKPIVLNKLLAELKNEDIQWGQIFTINKAVRDTRIKTFQYKVLYDLIPCNQYLFKIGKSETENCSRCNIEDNISHYFYSCAETKLFWNSFINWWKNITNEDINLTSISIRIGILGNYVKNETLNACILMAKWHIYKNKLNESQIFFYRFLCDIKYFLIIEKNIHLKQGKIQQYTKKWQIIEDYIT